MADAVMIEAIQQTQEKFKDSAWAEREKISSLEPSQP